MQKQCLIIFTKCFKLLNAATAAQYYEEAKLFLSGAKPRIQQAVTSGETAESFFPAERFYNERCRGKKRRLRRSTPCGKGKKLPTESANEGLICILYSLSNYHIITLSH